MATIKDDIFILSETEKENQLVFYRQDRKRLEGNLENFEKKIFKMYEKYIILKVILCKIPDSRKIKMKINLEMSENHERIIVTYAIIKEESQSKFKKWLKKIFED